MALFFNVLKLTNSIVFCYILSLKLVLYFTLGENDSP